MVRDNVPMTATHFVPLIRLAGRAREIARVCSFKEDLETRGWLWERDPHEFQGELEEAVIQLEFAQHVQTLRFPDRILVGSSLAETISLGAMCTENP